MLSLLVSCSGESGTDTTVASEENPQTTEATPGETSTTAESTTREPSTINYGIGGAGSFAFLTAYVALGNGYLEEELAPLNVTFDQVDMSPTEGISALATGNLDFIAADAATALIAYAQGADIQQIVTFYDTGVLVVVAEPGIDVEDPADMVEGRVWGVPSLGSSAHTFALVTLEAWGYEQDAVEFVLTGPTVEARAAVDRGVADVYWVGIPFGEELIQSGQMNLALDFYDPAVNAEIFAPQAPIVTMGVLGRPEYMEANPDVAAAVVRAHVRALEFMHENRGNPDAFRSLLPDVMQIDLLPEVLDRVLTDGLSRDGIVRTEGIETNLAVLRTGELVDENAEVDIDAFVSNEYHD
ncbi:MAG TPA: ABC transporter substrate-binding protein [Acidimicrobiia bacterium]|nr:ABC transporter substrate-binding protein [Acidimicrobiia bacterium]